MKAMSPSYDDFERWVLQLGRVPLSPEVRDRFGCPRSTANKWRWQARQRHPGLFRDEAPEGAYAGFERWVLGQGELPTTMEICRTFSVRPKIAYHWRDEIRQRHAHIDVPLSAIKRAVLAALATTPDQPQRTSAIAKFLGEDRAKVQTALQTLHEAGELVRHGDAAPHRYGLPLDRARIELPSLNDIVLSTDVPTSPHGAAVPPAVLAW
jgi:transposase-like protein